MHAHLPRRSFTQRGFTVIETAIVLAIVGVILSFSVPSIVRAMTEYRLRMATRVLADQIIRVKTQAVSNNAYTSLVVDTGNLKVGMITHDQAGAVLATTYVPLPSAISFGRPTGISAPITGAPTSANVSLPAQGTSTTVFQQDFTSRGFPNVTAGTMNAVYLTNGRTYFAVTLNSVGGVRLWIWQGGAWQGTTA